MVETKPFDWVRRMGVHEAYHLDPTNRLIHWICIPLELAALLKLLSLVPTPVDLGLVAIGAIGLLYLAVDRIGGAAMIGMLIGLWALAATLTSGSAHLDALVAVGAFALAFVFQTRVGHGVFERGLDDTAMNLAEFRRTKNPIPLVLVFYYHALELLFAAGYRPTLAARMHAHRARELARLPNDPRGR
jgi:uncharacterized membrane protein YGL010W